jgi:cobalt transporter subunit CbtA
MITRGLLAAIFIGLLSGFVMTAVQQWRVVPLIIAAEAFENGAPAEHNHAAVKSNLSWVSEAQAHVTNETNRPFDMPRLGGTLVANLVTGSGFALLLFGFSTLVGKPVRTQTALTWAACAWLSVHFFPAVGLPPELPGFPEVDLQARQIWWVATVGLSAAGITAIALKDSMAFKLAGMALIVIPHVFGAPQPSDISSALPAYYAAAYAVAALTASLISWLVIAFGLALANDRLEKGVS